MSKRLLKIGTLLSIINALNGVLGYGFQLLMASMLAAAEYSTFAAISAVIAISSSPVTAGFILVTRNVARWNNDSDFTYIRHQFKKYSLNIAVISACATISLILIYLYSGKIIKGVAIEQAIISLLAFWGTLLTIRNNAFLQGLQCFGSLASLGVVTILTKIIIGSGFVLGGMGLNGALLGVFISVFVANLIGKNRITVSTDRFGRINGQISPVASHYTKVKYITVIRDHLPYMLACIAITVMTQIDVVLVNQFFKAEVAAGYAVVATLGKAIFYLPGGFATALFPMVAVEQLNKGNVQKYILNACVATFSFCLIGVGFFWLIGDFIFSSLYDDRYAEFSSLLKYYALAMVPMGMVIVGEYYTMSMGKVLFAWLSAAIAPLMVSYIYFSHESIGSVIASVGIFNTILMVTGYTIMFLGELRKNANGPQS